MTNQLIRLFAFCFIISMLCSNILAPKENIKIPHLITKGNSKQLIVKGIPFIMLGGELNNSSSSSLDFLETTWARLTAFNLNTVLIPVTWEMIEPFEGKFDFSNVEGLIKKARENNLKLVLLWFGTWKNASSSYAPSWVRQDLKRFVRSESGDGLKLNHISALCAEACAADAKAFATLMKYIKSIDETDNTVLAIQVENESGIRGDSRDRSALATEKFEKNVPNELMNYLKKNKKQLLPEMKQIWENSNFKDRGNWREIFGKDANLIFMAWNTACYVNNVAAAGKSVYPLPMYANAWLEWSDDNKPGDYPSGGPIAKVMSIWKAAAPNIDILAPDIYRNDFVNVCTQFNRIGNALFIPEAQTEPISSANAFYAFGQSAICFSPFGIDNRNWFPDEDPIGISYRLLSQLMPYLQQFQCSGKMLGIVGVKGEKQQIKLGKYYLNVSFTGNQKPELPGSGLIISIAEDEFLVAGKGFTVSFISQKNVVNRTEILSSYEMIFKDNSWEKQRRLNGDETKHGELLKMTEDKLTVKTVKLFSY